MALGNLNAVSYYNVFYYPQEMKEQFDRSIFLEGLSNQERHKFEEVYVRLLRKLSIAGKGNQLLLKNPASTARVELLNRLFEGARFVHIVRNPFEVFASMLHHYPRLLNAFAWQKFDNIDLEEMVFYKYRRLMQGYLDQRGLVADRLIETSYEKLVSDPVGEIKEVYDQFGLTNREEAIKCVTEYADSGKNYKRNQYQITRAQVDRIKNEWGFALDQWEYDLPDSIEVI